ncbi:MAG TPA: alpha/beta fold hydrolase, partial [Symbiobacteriaceae bacterium]|nr:alpha/beta fold hydrolase [Symbiobacteriaceae bacterium]
MVVAVGPGRRIDIGGVKLYLHASGEGQGPTVILESGNLMPAVLWEPVQARVGRFARVVSYDRAGYGWSDPAGRNRSWPVVVDELHTLLQRAGIRGPYILVGHSLGGLYVRLFAARYPTEVAGMVLVDAWQEDLRRNLPPSHHRLDWWSRRLMVLLCALGIMRAAVRRNPGILAGGDGSWLEQFPPERRAALFGAL